MPPRHPSWCLLVYVGVITDISPGVFYPTPQMSASRRESVDVVTGSLFGGRHLPIRWADIPAHRLIKRKAPRNPDGAIPALPVSANTSEAENEQKCFGRALSISAFFGAGHMDIPRL